MENKTPKKPSKKPDLSSLIGTITEKRSELSTAPMQVIVPVEENLSRGKAKKIGRPSVKNDEISYTRLSPRIPADLKTELDVAIARKSFFDSQGMAISTIDEFITEAILRMLNS